KHGRHHGREQHGAHEEQEYGLDVDGERAAHDGYERAALLPEPWQEDAAHDPAAQQVARDRREGRAQAERQRGEELPDDDLAAAHGRDQQRLERAALLLAGRRVDRRHLAARKRPDRDEERDQPRHLARGPLGVRRSVDRGDPHGLEDGTVQAFGTKALGHYRLLVRGYRALELAGVQLAAEVADLAEDLDSATAARCDLLLEIRWDCDGRRVLVFTHRSLRVLDLDQL